MSRAVPRTYRGSRWSAIIEAVCPYCPRRCRLAEGAEGVCRARKNLGGKSVSVNYGKLTAVALDPIEKKPLARFFPGSYILSVGSFGCNMSCPFCQNSRIAAASELESRFNYVAPEKLAAAAKELEPRGNIGLAFTYNEPMTGFEYVRDAAACSASLGMKNVVVTNGSFCIDAQSEVLPYIDAWNIDLKSFNADTYRYLGGDLETVKAFIERAALRSHVELTTLIVPGLNDTESEMRELSSWVASVDPAVPLHVTRFFPHGGMSDKLPTDISLMKKLAAVAEEKLETVLLGNV